MRITFLGTGTSMGIPVIGCDCRVCQSKIRFDKRLRTSVWIELGGVNIIIDTGSDFRQQALRAGIKSLDAGLFTHHHADHIFGLDEIRPFKFSGQKRIKVCCTKQTLKYLKKVFFYIFDNHDDRSVDPAIETEIIDNRMFNCNDINITPVPLLHGNLPVMGFRIGRFAYCTDVSYIPESSYERLTGLEILVLGALRYKPHPTHFTIEEAVREAEKINAEKTYLVHLSHCVSHRELMIQLPANIQPAYDGLQLFTETHE